MPGVQERKDGVNNKDIYAVSIVAVQILTNAIHHRALIIIANSLSEAESIGLQRNYQLCPLEHGFVNHASKGVAFIANLEKEYGNDN